jgi:hypothetical protein
VGQGRLESAWARKALSCFCYGIEFSWRRTDSEKAFNSTMRASGNKAKHTGNPNVDQQGNRANVRPIRPDRAIVADHRARARAQPHSSFVMLRAVRVRIEDAARNSQGRCNPQRMGFPPVTAMVAPET